MYVTYGNSLGPGAGLLVESGVTWRWREKQWSFFFFFFFFCAQLFPAAHIFAKFIHKIHNNTFPLWYKAQDRVPSWILRERWGFVPKKKKRFFFSPCFFSQTPHIYATSFKRSTMSRSPLYKSPGLWCCLSDLEISKFSLYYFPLPLDPNFRLMLAASPG